MEIAVPRLRRDFVDVDVLSAPLDNNQALALLDGGKFTSTFTGGGEVAAAGASS